MQNVFTNVMFNSYNHWSFWFFTSMMSQFSSFIDDNASLPNCYAWVRKWPEFGYVEGGFVSVWKTVLELIRCMYFKCALKTNLLLNLFQTKKRCLQVTNYIVIGDGSVCYVMHRCSSIWSISKGEKFSRWKCLRFTSISSFTMLIRSFSSSLVASQYFIFSSDFMVMRSMLSTPNKIIIRRRLFPVIELQSFLIQLYSVLIGVFVELVIFCVMNRLISASLICRVSDNGSIKYLCVEWCKLNIFLVATFHVL